MFHIAGATKNDFLIGHLVAVSVTDLAIQVIWKGLASHQWSDAQLQLLQAQVQGMDCLADSWNALRAERAGFGNAMFDYLRSLPRKKLFPMLQNMAGGPGLESIMGGLTLSPIPTGWLYFEQLNYHRLFEEQLLPIFDMAARRVYPQRAAQRRHSTRSCRGSSRNSRTTSSPARR